MDLIAGVELAETLTEKKLEFQLALQIYLRLYGLKYLQNALYVG